MLRVWNSTQDFAEFIIENTRPRGERSGGNFDTQRLFESDANNPKGFHKSLTT
jgi:hypothetical protein